MNNNIINRAKLRGEQSDFELLRIVLMLLYSGSVVMV